MKKIYFPLLLLFFLVFNFFIFSYKTYALNFGQAGGDTASCSDSNGRYTCYAWVCTLGPKYAYARGSLASCTKTATNNYKVTGCWGDTVTPCGHECWFDKLYSLYNQCGPYPGLTTLSHTNRCVGDFSVVRFFWQKDIADTISYNVRWNDGTDHLISTNSCTSGVCSYPNRDDIYVIVNENVNITWSVEPCNEVGCFGTSYYGTSGLETGSAFTSKVCVLPTATPTTTPTPTPTPTPRPTFTPTPRPTSTPTPTPRPTATPTPEPTPTPRPTNTPTPRPTPYPTPTPLPPPPPPPNCGSYWLDGAAPNSVPTGGICMLEQIVRTIIDIMLILVVVLAITFLMWGGISWTTSGGDKQKLAKAKTMVSFAIIGLTIALTSFAVIKFIFQVLDIKFP